MPLQPIPQQELGCILAEASQRLAAAHMAYAEQRFQPTHAEDAFDVRNVMISMLATFEDGPGYGQLCDEDGTELRRAMRHMEEAASALIDAMNAYNALAAATRSV